MASNGGADDGAELERMVDGLRHGDLSFVFSLAVRFGATILAHPSLPPDLVERVGRRDQPEGSDRVVHEVVLALADLARSPAVADRAAEDLLADAIERVVLVGGCHSPSA